MTSLYHQSSLYKIPQGECRSILHQEPRKLKFIVLLYLEVEIQPEMIEMLDKIGDALKLDKNEREYLVFNSPIVLSDWQRKYEAENVLVFGAEAQDLNVQAILQKYQLYTFETYRLLMVNQVVDVYNNQQLKARLWKSLQQMFS